MKRTLFIIGIVFTLIFPWRSFASVMTIAPSPSNPDLIVVSLDTQGDTINAIQGHLTFNTGTFSVSTISDGGSIINFWIEPPAFSNTSGTIDFAGIIPGGEVTSNGIIATIAIVPTGLARTSSVTITSAQALLNDGNATPSDLAMVSKPFPLIAGSIPLVGANTQAPIPFTPEIGQEASIFNGQYFVAFSAMDQGSGIDHYDVLEVPAGVTVTTSSVGWQTASSPYLLKDQTLSSDIYVRAFDRSGNFRTEEIPAKYKIQKLSPPWWDIGISVGAIVLLLIVAGFIRKRRIWKKKRSIKIFV
jgi:hypothetical protein